MWLMLQQDQPDDFVIATNKTRTVKELVELSFKEINIEIVLVAEKGGIKYYVIEFSFSVLCCCCCCLFVIFCIILHVGGRGSGWIVDLSERVIIVIPNMGHPFSQLFIFTFVTEATSSDRIPHL